jgi:signal transduction histidine kinase
MLPALKSHFIDIRTEMDQSVEFYADKNLLGQAIYNIIHNAQEVLVERNRSVKRIQLSLKKQNKTAYIIVADTGGGIDENVRTRIFDPFFTTKDLSHKTGTGLYFAKNIIEGVMGGHITASNTGEGAQFTITLPIAKPGYNGREHDD